MSSPCYKCVCLAICKFKPIYHLYKGCKLLGDYCRPFGSDRVDLMALSYTNQNLGRNFQAIKHDDSDQFPNIIRDVDKLEELRKEGNSEICEKSTTIQKTKRNNSL